MKKEIQDLMKPFFEHNRDIYSELTEKEVSFLETKYNVKLPDSFKWYITEYFFSGLAIDIPAKANKTGINCLDTLNERFFKEIPERLFVISNVDEYLYCLDTNRLINNECPVVTYSSYDKDGIIDDSENFYIFLINDIKNSIDNDFFNK